jgi:hypothetical protein
MNSFCRFLLTGLLGTLPLTALALPGDADPAYGTSGTALVSFTPLLGTDHYHYGLKTALDNQGRLWAFSDTVHEISPTQSEEGVGITRLTRQGRLDTGFGSNGLMYFPANNFNGLIGVRSVNGQTYLGFSTGGMDQDPTITWEVCRFNAGGALDSSWFGSGCATLTFGNYNRQTDLVVDPVSGNVWIVGVAQDANTHLDQMLLGIFNNTNHTTQLQRYGVTGQNISAVQGVPDSGGGLYFSADAYVSNNNLKIIAGHLAPAAGGTFTLTTSSQVGFTAAGTAEVVAPRCIARTAQGKLQVGVQISAPNNIEWGTVQFLANGDVDTAYGDNGSSHDVVQDQLHAANSNNSPISDCVRDADGRLDMVGSTFFQNDALAAQESVPTVHRMQAGGYADQAFGGDTTVPGTTYGMAYPGTAMNNFRQFTPPKPRKDLGTSIQVQANGMLLVAGISDRQDGNGHADIAVMRVQTEDPIFADGME